MPRKPFVYIAPLPVHVTARCINRDWFGMSPGHVWEIMSDYLFFISKAYGVQIYSFVLMGNHFHLKISAPNNNLSEAMMYFLRETSRIITKSTDRINQTYGNRFYRCLIENHSYFQHSYKYLYRNPVEAGIVDRVEDYPFSSLNGLLGQRKLIFPVTTDHYLMADPERVLNWLNQRPTDENRYAVSCALRKVCFRLPKRNGRSHELESIDY